MVMIGQVEELRRYPVKSMGGEMLAAAQIRPRGLEGDRVCAFIDEETGKVVTAKLPHRWRAMLAHRATYGAEKSGEVRVAFPDGSTLSADDGEALADALSAALGRRVRLSLERPEELLMDRAIPEAVAEAGSGATVESIVLPVGMGAPEGGFFDYAPIHVIATASLDAIAADSLAGVAEPVRFRPNIVIRTDPQPFLENDWVGGVLAIGDAVRLRVTLATPRCAIPTLAHGSVPPDPKLTLNVAKRNKVQILDMGMLPCLGAYAEVLAIGEVRVDDPVVWSPA